MHTPATEHPGTLEALLEAMDDPVVILDAHGRVRGANAAARRCFGEGLESQAGASLGLDWRAPDRIRPLESDELPLARALALREDGEAEVFLRAPGLPWGLHFIHRVRCLADGRVLALWRDVSEWRRGQTPGLPG